VPESILSQASKVRIESLPSDPKSLERGVRQCLADKVTGNLLGLWLLIPELLRLGVWDLLCGWTGRRGEYVEPRLALQLVNEAALCVTGIRARRSLGQRGLELANGLYFLASDMAVHELLAAHTVAEAQGLQVALGKLRRASDHFRGSVLAVDPHRIRSYTKRQMRRRRKDPDAPATKTAQTFFLLDADTGQPVCFTTGTAACTATTAALRLLDLATDILEPEAALVLVDTEHFTTELLDDVKQRTQFDLLVPMPARQSLIRQLRALPPETFHPRWAGYATAKRTYTPHHSTKGPFYQYLQRSGERAEDYHYKAFLSTRDADEVAALAEQFPKRWHVEEFFNAEQALGWNRAGTCNLNIRYGQMSLALIAQAVIHQFRKRIGPPVRSWDTEHLAKSYFAGLQGDVRVKDGETILVTYYNANDPELLAQCYADLPRKLEADNTDPRIPWLYNFKLDFCFR
jgi:Transposase DDE domain